MNSTDKRNIEKKSNEQLNSKANDESVGKNTSQTVNVSRSSIFRSEMMKRQAERMKAEKNLLR